MDINADILREAFSEAERRTGYRHRRVTDLASRGLEEGQWFEFTPVDGPGPATIVRIDRTPSGELIVTGLVMGADRAQVTGRQLRAVKLGAILDAFAGVRTDPNSIPGETFGEAQDRLGVEAMNREIFLIGGFSAISWLQSREVEEVDAPAPRRGVPPSDDLLKRFAERYLANLQLQPRRAMTATAEELYIDRSTANRYARLCREPHRGYLPPKESS